MKFRKKPVVIEATQYNPPEDKGYDDTQWDEVQRIADELGTDRDQFEEDTETATGKRFLVIETPEGFMTANPGDWIIKGVEDEVYPCAESIFTKTYDPVE